MNTCIRFALLGVLLLAMSGVISVELLKLVERKIAPWRQFDLKA